MPHFFFDIHDAHDTRDDAGQDLVDMPAVQAEAIKALTGIAQAEMSAVGSRELSVSVRDDSGRQVFGATLTLYCTHLG